MLLGAATEARLFGALEARRAARGVTVVTGDGSVGIAGSVVDALPDLLRRTDADVVYAAGPGDVLHGVARVAEAHGAWSQTAVDVPTGCGMGLCLSCVLPAVGEDGVTRMVRACAEGPVFRGDRVRWDDLGTVPADARGAS
jgi:dihydroorotate dehydrogenase electron transfer subunit